MPRAAIVALLLLLGSLWGLTFSLAKIGTQGGIEPLGYAALMQAGVGGVLLALCAARGVRVPRDRATLVYAAISGIGSAGIPGVVMFFSVRHLPAGILALIVTLAPMITYGLSLAVGVERPALRRALGMAIGFAGAGLIVVPRASLPSPELLPWALLAMLTPLFYAATTVFIARARPAGVDSLALAALAQLAAAAAMLPAAVATGQLFIPGPPIDAAQLALATHVVVGVLTQFLFFELTRIAGPVFFSQVAYVVTLTGLFWGWVLFGETHSLWVWLAAAVIVAGVALVSWPARRRAREAGA